MSALTASTDEVPPGRAFEYWQDLICDTFVQLSAAPTTEAPFRGRIAHTDVGAVELTTVRASGQHVRRTPRLIARSSEEYVLASIQVAGRGTVAQDGRTAPLRPGAMAFYDSTRPYALHFPGSFEQLVVQVPRRLLPEGPVLHATGVALGASSSARLVADFFRGLARARATDPAGSAALAPHALGLLTSALTLAAGTTAPRGDGATAVDRERVLAHLAARYADPRLDADRVAAACHLSRRTLFRLFEGEPEGLGDVLRRLRVTAAQDLLRTQPRMPLAAVAGRCGFAGEAQFHRAFRAVTGSTPAAYRRAALGAP
ncbi:helix-turn-helix domain-containing protein [Blastococcus sp. SYSU D00669]